MLDHVEYPGSIWVLGRTRRHGTSLSIPLLRYAIICTPFCPPAVLTRCTSLSAIVRKSCVSNVLSSLPAARLY